MKVLYLSHTSEIGGAEISLLGVLAGPPPGVVATLACPDGLLAERARIMGVGVHVLAGAAGGPRMSSAGAWEAACSVHRSGARLAELSQTHAIDLVHANSLRAGVVAAAARTRGGSRVVLHVRDMHPRAERASRAALAVATASASRVIANSAYVRATLPAHARARCTVVHNAVDSTRFDPARHDAAAVRRALGVTGPIVATIAQLTPWKGQLEAVDAVAELRRAGRELTLLVVGSPKFISAGARHDHVAYAARLRERSVELGVGDRVRFLGERDDIEAILAATDIALVPSHQEPFGRAVIEAMAMAVPVISTSVGGPSEIIRNGIDGVLLAPRDPSAWADAIGDLLDHPARRARLGANARRRVCADFTPAAHRDGLARVYRHVGARSGVRRFRATHTTPELPGKPG